MTETQAPSNHRYLAEFVDGPLAGRSETRVLIDGTHDNELSAMAAIDSAESIFWYVAGDTREIDGELHVRYSFDPRESDPTQSDDGDESLRL